MLCGFLFLICYKGQYSQDMLAGAENIPPKERWNLHNKFIKESVSIPYGYVLYGSMWPTHVLSKEGFSIGQIYYPNNYRGMLQR